MKRIPAKYLPLVGIIVGAIGGGVYWLAAQFWPSSVAVVLSLFATTLLNERMSGDSFAERRLLWTDLFALLITYNALMALTAANPGFPLPANLALGFSPDLRSSSQPRLGRISVGNTSGDRAASVGWRLERGAGARLRPLDISGHTGADRSCRRHHPASRIHGLRQSSPRAAPPGVRETARQLAEACFYLGALAAWNYI